MAKLSRSFRDSNRTTRVFRERYSKLPKHVQEAVRASAILFDQNPNHPALENKPIECNGRGNLHEGTFSVRVTIFYRALYVRGSTNVWYWVGPHSEYDRMIGKKSRGHSRP